MLVIVLECAPPKVVGYCSSWALQIATGVYVGNLPASQREAIWEQIEEWAEPDTRVTMIWPSKRTEQGLACRTLGAARRSVVAREDLLVSTWIPRPTRDLYETGDTTEQTP